MGLTWCGLAFETVGRAQPLSGFTPALEAQGV